jgi:hypothetical protein
VIRGCTLSPDVDIVQVLLPEKHINGLQLLVLAQNLVISLRKHKLSHFDILGEDTIVPLQPQIKAFSEHIDLTLLRD